MSEGKHRLRVTHGGRFYSHDLGFLTTVGELKNHLAQYHCFTASNIVIALDESIYTVLTDYDYVFQKAPKTGEFYELYMALNIEIYLRNMLNNEPGSELKLTVKDVELIFVAVQRHVGNVHRIEYGNNKDSVGETRSFLDIEIGHGATITYVC